MTAKSFAEHQREDRRLVLLRLLAEGPGYSLNSSNLHAGLEYLRIHVTRADLLDDLRWLAAQGLVRMEPIIDGVYGCELTAAGADVVAGIEHVPGIARARPR